LECYLRVSQKVGYQMNWHDKLLINDLKNQPLILVVLYLLIGFFSLVVGLQAEGMVSKWLCAGGGFLIALSIEKLVTRRIRVAASQLSEVDSAGGDFKSYSKIDSDLQTSINSDSELSLSDDKSLLQLECVHSFLQNAYWCQGIPFQTFKSAVEGSICFGGYYQGRQVAFARVVTDGATFAWLCDVIVDPSVRGKGFSKKLMTYVMAHPQMQGFRRICLATKDAHALYEKFNFKITETPQNWMEIKDNNIYLRSKR
jgi:GNAT superfamily N-acetyltransferase